MYVVLIVILLEEIGAGPIPLSLYMTYLSEGDFSSYGLGYLIRY